MKEGNSSLGGWWLAIKAQLLPKMFSFVIFLVIFIIFASILFAIMSFLNIKIDVDLIFNPIYDPLKSQMLAMAIAQSEMGDKIQEYAEGKIDKTELEEINKVIPSYKISIGDKTIGNPKVSGEEVQLGFWTSEGKKIEIVTIV